MNIFGRQISILKVGELAGTCLHADGCLPPRTNQLAPNLLSALSHALLLRTSHLLRGTKDSSPASELSQSDQEVTHAIN